LSKYKKAHATRSYKAKNNYQTNIPPPERPKSPPDTQYNQPPNSNKKKNNAGQKQQQKLESRGGGRRWIPSTDAGRGLSRVLATAMLRLDLDQVGTDLWHTVGLGS
jgi:hypothetical protein